MSSQRLKKLAARIALGARIGYILTVISMLLQSVSLLWLTIMPNKFISFFDKVRIYEPFITDIKNNALSLFELSSGIISLVFLFVVLRNVEKIFLSIAKDFTLHFVAHEIKVLSACFFIEAIAVPVMKILSYTVFLKSDFPTGVFDISALVISLFLWYLGQTIQTKSIEKEENKDKAI